MNKGDIFIATDKSKHPHPIVFLETLSEGKFKACILSTKGGHGNLKMSDTHFTKVDENRNEYTVTFKNSHLVPYRVFEKEELWLSTQEPKGRLTEEGIRFIEKYTSDINSEYHPIPISKTIV